MARESYPPDLSDGEWTILAPLIPPARPGRHPRVVDIREIVNGDWRMLPHDLPPHDTVYG